ncbi:MAG: superoxide dismutase [Alteraurantiacibacter sp.]
MAFTLIDLPYAKGALAPAISAETLDYHHGKHHQAYLDKTNAAVAEKGLGDHNLEEVIAAGRGSDKGLFNNAAQSWNHGFYWHSLAPSSVKPTGELASKIDAAFGSLEDLAKQLKDRGAGHFASGWVWLVDQGGRLEVAETHDGDTFADGEANPLLVIDLWEHAYYIDHRNARPAYLSAVVDQHLNWDFAAENLARGTIWTYPG